MLRTDNLFLSRWGQLDRRQKRLLAAWLKRSPDKSVYRQRVAQLKRLLSIADGSPVRTRDEARWKVRIDRLVKKSQDRKGKQLKMLPTQTPDESPTQTCSDTSMSSADNLFLSRWEQLDRRQKHLLAAWLKRSKDESEWRQRYAQLKHLLSTPAGLAKLRRLGGIRLATRVAMANVTQSPTQMPDESPAQTPDESPAQMPESPTQTPYEALREKVELLFRAYESPTQTPRNARMSELPPSVERHLSVVAETLNASFGCQELDQSPTQTTDESPTQMPDESPNASPNQKPDESLTPNQTETGNNSLAVTVIGAGCLIVGGLGLLAWYGFNRKNS